MSHSALYSYLKIYDTIKSMYNNTLAYCFEGLAFYYTYTEQAEQNNRNIQSLEKDLYNLELANRNIVRESKAHSKEQELQEKKEEVSKVKRFIHTNCTKQPSILFPTEQYGTINMNTIHKIYRYPPSLINLQINQASEAIQKRSYSIFYSNKADPLLHEGESMQEFYLHLLLYYAIREPENTSKYEQCINIYKTINKMYCIDLLLGELYAISQLKSKTDVALRVKLFLESTNIRTSPKDYISLASMMNYLKMTDIEYEVLSYMRNNKMILTPQIQERLIKLETLDTTAPEKLEVTTNANQFYIDTDSTNWNEKDYEGFFNNLDLQKDRLNYHLAIRNDHQHLIINKVITLPEHSIICDALNLAFNEEYGDVIKTRFIQGEIITNNQHNPIEGYLVTIDESPQLGIFLHMIKLGKKLNINFYTLYMPRDSSAIDQKKVALSIYKQSTPTIIAWEESLKDSILLALQNLLNKTTNIETNDKKNNPIIF